MKYQLLLQSLFSLFLIILIPTYWQYYGAQNFLWFSDIGLFLTFIGLWLDSSFLISIVTLLVFPFELLWNIDFFIQLITNYNTFGIVNYMFDPKYSWFVKSLSLFHIFLPIIWFWYLYKNGYQKEALSYALILFWIVILLSYMFTKPEANINWVFMPAVHNWSIISFYLWLAVMLIGMPLFIMWPLHEILKRYFA